MTKKKANHKKRRAGAFAFSGMMDIIIAAIAAVGIVILLLMLGSLVSWLRQDITVTFGDLTHNITDAVIINGQ